MTLTAKLAEPGNIPRSLPVLSLRPWRYPVRFLYNQSSVIKKLQLLTSLVYGSSLLMMFHGHSLEQITAKQAGPGNNPRPLPMSQLWS